MPEAPPLTRELALRLEEWVAPLPTQLEPGWTCRIFGQTIAIQAKTGRPFNKVFCLGQDDLVHLPAILDFYAAEKLDPTFYLTPARFTPKVGAALTAAGFAQRDLSQAILYGVPDPHPPALPAPLTIERVTDTSVETFVQITAEGFEWPEAWREPAKKGLRASIRAEDQRFLARWNGIAAGVATLSIGEGRASLGGGAVIRDFRGRGIQLALLRYRLHQIYQLDAGLLVTGGADYNSTSFRNQQRVGLRLAYVESAWCSVI